MATTVGSRSNSLADWLTKNIGSATWWRSRALSQGVTDEGGVDVPLTAGTPIYALATGPLRGAGYFYHGGPYFSTQEYGASSNAPGYGVVSQQVNVPGVGIEDLYYQHIDIAPGINFCQSGNCGGQVVQEGQLIGYSKNPPGETEVGLGANTSWGGIWGAVSDPGQWVSDPRSALTNLASSGGGPVASTNPNCKKADPSWCAQASQIPSFCASDYYSPFPQCPCTCTQPSVPFVSGVEDTATALANIGTNVGNVASALGNIGDFFGNIGTAINNPDWWKRVGIGTVAVILIIGALFLFVKNS